MRWRELVACTKKAPVVAGAFFVADAVRSTNLRMRKHALCTYVAELQRNRSCDSGRTSVVAPRWSSPKYSRGTPRTMTSGRLSSASPLTSAALAHSRSEEHTSELQSLMRISYAVFCLKKKKQKNNRYKI